MDVYSLKEKNCYEFTFTLKDKDGNAIQLATLSTLYLTLYCYNEEIGSSDRYHLATINGRYNQNVKNAHDVTVSASGTVVWNVQAADTTLKDSAKTEELHRALFTWYWDGKRNSKELNLYIEKVYYTP